MNLSGFIPWLMWRGFYLRYVPTLARNARLYLEWNWAMFFPPDIAHLRFTRTDAPAPIHGPDTTTGTGRLRVDKA